MKTHLFPTLLLLAACGAEPEPVTPERTGPLDVRSLSWPAHWLVEQVGGDHIQLRAILPAGEDAMHWRPEPELIAGLAQSDLIVANGAGYEAWIATATLPADALVQSARGLSLVEVEATTHSHGTDGEHSHGTIDPHTWGSPALYAQQAAAVATALGAADPANAAAYSAAATALTQELATISEVYAEAFSRAGDSRIASSQPSYRYLARELGVEIHALDLQPGSAPSVHQLAAFEAWAGDAESPILLWEAIPTSEVKAAFPDGVRHVWLDPLEQPGASGSYDYLAQVRANINAVGDLFPLPEAVRTPLQGRPNPGPPAKAKPGPKQGGKGMKAKR